jgi:ferredoxin
MGYNINIPIRYGAFDADKRADSCIGCGQCTNACPQNIDVPSVLADFAQKMSQYEDWDSICRTRNAIAAEMLAIPAFFWDHCETIQTQCLLADETGLQAIPSLRAPPVGKPCLG